MKILFTTFLFCFFSLQTVMADIASGRCGSCEWIIDDDGQMVIKPVNGTDGELDDWESVVSLPWEPFRDRIVAFRTEGSVRARTCAFMFYQCSRLRKADLSGLVTDKVRDMRLMFDGCSEIEEIDASHFCFTDVQNMSRMFKGCKKLRLLNLGPFELRSMKEVKLELVKRGAEGSRHTINYGYGHVFDGCDALNSITVTSTKPQKIFPDFFTTIPHLQSCTLYVPKDRVKKYRKAKGWRVFTVIKEM